MKPKVRQLLAMTRRVFVRRGALPHKKDALTKDPLQAWLDAAGISAGPIFRRVLRGGHVGLKLWP